MNKICIITGGGGGIGLAAAKLLGQEYYIIIADRNRSKLAKALNELNELHLEAEAMIVDVSSSSMVKELAQRAQKLGEVKIVIHAASISASKGDPEMIMRVNTLGTINVNSIFYAFMGYNSCIIDISSLSAYLLPKLFIPKKNYRFSQSAPEKFLHKMLYRVALFPEKYKSQIAYDISKNFVSWYVKKDAARFGEKGVRILSVSPGSFEIEPGKIEQAGWHDYIQYSALKRVGKVEEIACLIAHLADEKCGYLTGTDIICDGGLLATGINPFIKEKMQKRQIHVDTKK